MEEPYEVALSFAGEERSYIDEVAGGLRSHGVRVFYDSYQQADLWGKDLGEELSRIYSNAKYTVMFISESYVKKEWTTVERRSALERMIIKKVDSVLPVRFDDVDVPGLPQTIAYIDLRETSPSQLVHLFLQKLGKNDGPVAAKEATSQQDDLQILADMVDDRESLVRLACAERLTVGWLDGLFAVPLERLLPVFRDFAVMASHEWEQKLTGLLAARLGLPAFDLALDIAGDGAVGWGQRTTALTWLRYASLDERKRVSASVNNRISSDGIDAQRLRVIAYGYLGDRMALLQLADDQRVTSSSYASEKLGTYFAHAYLNAYVHHGDEFLSGGDLDHFERHVESVRRNSRYTTGFFDYLQRLGKLEPGRAGPVLDVATRMGDTALLDAVLTRLSAAPNPNLVDRVAGWVEQRGRVAAIALAFTGTDRSAEHLAQLVDGGVTDAVAAAALSVGVHLEHSAAGQAMRTLDHSESLIASYAAWSLTRLARDGSQEAEAALRKAIGTHPDSYVRSTAAAGLVEIGTLTGSDLHEQLGLTESFVERLQLGVAGAWLGDADAVELGLLAGIRNAAPLSWLEEPFHRSALDALGSRSDGPFDLLHLLASEAFIT